MAFQLGADKGMEIIPMEISLRSFCEAQVVVVQAAGLHHPTGVGELHFDV